MTTTRDAALVVQSLNELRDRARQILEEVPGPGVPPRLSPAGEELRGSVLRTAEHLSREARRAVKVGFFGEWAAGKSQLVSVLLGERSLLPVHSQPSTASATLLRLRPGSGDRTRIASASVTYVDQDELDTYGRYLVREAVVRAQEAAVEERQTQELRDWPDEPGSGRMEELLAWVRRVAPAQSRLVLLVPELEALTAAMRRPAPLGRGRPIDTRLADALVTLQDTGAGRGGAELEELRSQLPLVRYVEFDVEVAPAAWDLRALDMDVELVDVPGRGGGSAAARHDYLCGRELQEVDTRIIVIQADRGAGVSAADIPGIVARRGAALVKDGILVAASKFDRMPRDVGSGSAETGDAAPLVDVFPALRSLVTTARHLLGERDDRVLFLCALAALPPADRGADAGGVVEAARFWGQVAERHPADPFAPALAAYAADGGIRHLRRVIERHLAEHGLALRLARLRSDGRELVRRHRRLVRELTPAGPPPPPGGEVLIEIDDAFDAVERSLDDMREDATRRLNDVYYRSDGLSPSISDQIAARAAHSVHGWEQWERLRQSLRQGLVTVPSVEFAKRESVPIDAAAFVEPFVLTCAGLDRWLAPGLARVVCDWSDRWYDDELDEVRSGLERLFPPSAFAGPDDPSGTVAAIRDLREALEALSTLHDDVEVALNEREPVTESRVLAAFPLDRGRTMSWHPESPVLGTADARSVVRVMRIRRELVLAAAQLTALRVTRAQERALEVVEQCLDSILRCLSTCKLRRGELASIAAAAER